MFSAQANKNVVASDFIALQLSYSTADIEKNIFYASEYKSIKSPELVGKATFLVVHGEMIPLEENAVPQGSPPLTEQSGLFRIIGLAEQTEPQVEQTKPR